MKYSEIKENIINNFFNRNYRYTCISLKKSLLNDIASRSMFKFTYDFDKDIMHMNIGNNIEVDFEFVWEEKYYTSTLNKNQKMFRLIHIK